MENLKFTGINIRAVNVPLRKPVIAHLGEFYNWPFSNHKIRINLKKRFMN